LYDLSEVLNYRKKLLFHINRIQGDKLAKLMIEYKPINWNKKPRMTIENTVRQLRLEWFNK